MTILFQDNTDSIIIYVDIYNMFMLYVYILCIYEWKEWNPKQATPSSFDQAAKSYYRFNPIKTFPGLSLLWSSS